MADLVLIPLVWAASLCLDAMLGEPKKWHPLVGFGRLASAVERRLNRGEGRFFRGLLAVMLLLLPVLVLSAVVRVLPAFAVLLVDCLVLYLAIGWQSMREHLAAVKAGFDTGGLECARNEAAKLVSRNLAEANEQIVANAMLETSLENSCDALFASLFWYAVAGSVGVMLHRLLNTLDAMWGYRNARYELFGKVAARADDILAFMPSQLLALTFCVVSRRGDALACWWQQGWRWKSINAGSVMASGAAALSLRLGGEATYEGKTIIRAGLGAKDGRSAQLSDIQRALALVSKSLVMWFGAIMLIAIVSYGLQI